MRIIFDMPDSTAQLLEMSAQRMKLETGKILTPSEIAKALVHEILIDDAAEHGLTPEGQCVH